MKAGPQKELTLEEIAYQVDTHNLSVARLSLAEAIGAKLCITGIIERIAKRENVFRLVVSANSTNRKMAVFANFDDEAEKIRVKERKIKKGAPVSIIGTFQSFGSTAVCLNNCKLNK